MATGKHQRSDLATRAHAIYDAKLRTSWNHTNTAAVWRWTSQLAIMRSRIALSLLTRKCGKDIHYLPGSSP